MPFYSPEPPHRHDRSSTIGILLVNLGTPDAPTARSLRPYLREFLWDRRVVEIPRFAWGPILEGIILNTRPKHSAEKYASIWQPEGSPLKLHTERQTDLLREALARQTPVPLVVDYAMRYGQPSVKSVLARMREQGCDRILILPMYPQYAASSSGTALDAVWRVLLKTRNVPEIRAVRHFSDHPGYLAALRQSVESHWAEHGRPDVLVMSFHGIPRRSLDLGDPYHCECRKTGRLLAQALGLTEEQHWTSFQSRFGRAEWLKPYTAEVLADLGRQGTKRVDVICPGFVADCLETLEEIAMEGKATFLGAGGREFRYIAALNERPLWISALTDLVMTHLSGWLPTSWDEVAQGRENEDRLARARSLGAET